ncbi:MAG: GNAT family N-acetyltransferase [Bacteroidota bacterium]
MTVRHEPDHNRFAVDTDHGLAHLDYILTTDLISLVHTEVPVGAEGQGIGNALAKAGLDYARAEGLKVLPTCPFVLAYIRRHPEERDLVMAGIRV